MNRVTIIKGWLLCCDDLRLLKFMRLEQEYTSHACLEEWTSKIGKIQGSAGYW